ncbi:MAG TPA: hypothetical protein PKC80_03605 [Burkholderiaceae bacterium]|nr:hypothetical protein [Burkholderiaceae bacterium]
MHTNIRSIVKSHLLRLVAIAGFLSAVSACSINQPFVRADDSPKLNLSFIKADIDDQRAAFAQFMAQELSYTNEAKSEVWTWLHKPNDESIVKPVPDFMGQLFASHAGSTSVLIVPGFLGDCVDHQSVPFGDGITRPPEQGRYMAYGHYTDLGLHSIRTLTLPSQATSHANGHRIAQAIRDQIQQAGVKQLVLVAYSKGLTDTLYALDEMASNGGVPKEVKALVSVAGMVKGTPLAPQFRTLYAHFSPLLELFNCSASDGAEISDMDPSQRNAWLSSHPKSKSVKYYSITAQALSDELSPALKLPYGLLGGAQVPNDGQLLTGDAILPESMLLANARADHWDVALPLDRYPNPLIRAVAVGRSYPREALFRAIVRWVVVHIPDAIH